jgi:hypothetical protein
MCPNLPDLFAHMFNEHRFNIGLLNNLIFVDRFLNDLEEMIKLKKQCIYCKEIFRNGTCFRKHLKSKKHFKIDAKDERWDRFYLVNYVNLSRKSSGIKEKDDVLENEDDIDDWNDLTDEIVMKTQCLFCLEINLDPEICFEHMSQAHGFCIKSLRKHNLLDFYEVMKLVNYLRHCQTHEIHPFGPDSIDNSSVHFLRLKIPAKSLWDKPEFYFPVYEDDPLLTAIEDFDEEMA